MISFKKLVEEIVTPKYNLGIKRKDMPQIRKQYVPEFLSFLKKNNVRIFYQSFPVKLLKPTQNELNQDIIDKIKEKPDKRLLTSIIISKDMYILDGHHRMEAMKQIDPNLEITVSRTNINMIDLLELASKFPKVTYKHIKDMSKSSK